MFIVRKQRAMTGYTCIKATDAIKQKKDNIFKGMNRSIAIFSVG